MDWVGAMTGSFNLGTGFSTGGAYGDLDLPTLSGGLAWDASAFTSYGIIVVVPEPSRALLLMFRQLRLTDRLRRRPLSACLCRRFCLGRRCSGQAEAYSSADSLSA